MHLPTIDYHRRRPENTALYQVVQRYYPTLVQVCEQQGRPLPDFVVQEFEKFLRCGILAHGFARVSCCDCGYDRLVAFSCKRRGFCASCGGAWMAETSAHLVDHVFPRVPVRQWVMALPIPIRFLIAYNGPLQSAVLKCFIDSVSGHLKRKAKREYNLQSVSQAKPASITSIQRSDSAGKLNIHFHSLFADGVFVEDYREGPMSFAEVSAPTPEENLAVATETCRRTMKMLEKRGYWIDDQIASDQLPDTDPALAAFAQASMTGQLLFGPNAGAREMRVYGAAATDDGRSDPNRPRGYDFNLHAKRRVEADDPESLEKLCRYILRPPIANDRLRWVGEDKVALKLKRPWSDGTTELVFEALEFVRRLVPLIPMPRANRLRFHGAFAPNSPHRSRVVPQPQVTEEPLADYEHGKVQEGEGGTTSTRGDKGDGKKKKSRDPSQTTPGNSKRLGWAKCMARVFKLDVLQCPKCQGEMQMIAFITEGPVIRKILKSVGSECRLV